ncbi:MAG: beta strand repeat-containing protein, partial [Synechococcaceae cyanobacterium]
LLNRDAGNPRSLAINFTGSSTINASTSQQAGVGGKGGDILIGTGSTPSIFVSGAGSITAETKGSGMGGVLDLKAATITLSNFAKATTETSGSGDGGQINLNANSITLSNGATASALTSSFGEGGVISVNTDFLTLRGNSELTTKAMSTGNAGKILINSTNPDWPNPSFVPRDLSISFYGNSLINASTAFNGTLDPAKFDQKALGGSIFLGSSGRTLIISGLGKITAQTHGSGKGGFLDLKGSSISLYQTIATTETSGIGNGGQINLTANSIALDGGAIVSALTSGPGRGGNISVSAKKVDLQNKSILTTLSGTVDPQTYKIDFAKLHNTGPAGSIVLGFFSAAAGGSRLTLGQSEISSITTTKNYYGGISDIGSITADFVDIMLHDSFIATKTAMNAVGGSINLSASNLGLFGSSQLNAAASYTANAGDIRLNAYEGKPRDLAIVLANVESQINASTSYNKNPFVPGDPDQRARGGTISIGTSSKTLSVSGPGAINAETIGLGEGGSLYFKGSYISFDNNALATVKTSGSGNAGLINISANTIVLDGQSRITAQSGLYQGNEPGVSTPTGPAGSISITASGPNSLHLYNGSSITVATNSSTAFRDPSDLGDIRIRTPYLEMKGGSLISAKTDGAAQGGTISLEASRVDLDGGSRIRVDGPSKERSTASGTGQAGNINLIISKNLSLTNLSGINASTTASNSPQGGANINIWVGGDLLLSGNSSITAAAYGFANGGNILLRLPNGFLRAAFPVRGAGNDILATAEYGSGGLIDVSALAVIGFNFNTFGQSISEASTRAVSGRNGVTAIYTPNLDPDRGVVPIEQPIDPSSG